MGKAESVIPVKRYGREDFEAKQPKREPVTPDPALIIADLLVQNRRLLDKIARMERMIEDEVRFWNRGLQHGEWETREALRRRVSRLKGALDYQGNEHWLVAHEK